MAVVSNTLAILDRPAFADLEQDWGLLLQRSYDNRVFLTATWAALWWKHFSVQEPLIVTARGPASDLVGILPLARQGHVVSLLGDHNVSDYMDALAVKEDAQKILAALWDHALHNIRFEKIVLRHVPSASPLISTLQDLGPANGLRVEVSNDEVCPVAILCNDWEGYLKTLSKKQRHEIRRKIRRAQDGVEWDWRTARTEQDVYSDLEVFFRLHAQSADDKARFLTHHIREYLADLANTLLRENILWLSTFRRDGEDVASTLSFLYRGRYLLYNSGYAQSHAAFSPGIAAVALAIQDAIAAGAVAFDFLSGDEAYKYQFGASNTHTCRVEATRR